MADYCLSELKIEVTYECPLNCIHCSSESDPTIKKHIFPDKCLSIINEAKDLGVKKIAISGGEPLIYPEIQKIIKAVSSLNIHLTIYTTGNIPNIKQVFTESKKNGLNALAFSLYSPVSSEHEIVTRARGSFEKTIIAIKEAEKLGIESEIHFVALKRNYKQLPEVVSLAKQINIEKVSVLRFVPQGRGSLLYDQVLDHEDYMLLKKIIEDIRSNDFKLRTGSPLNFLLVNDSPICNSGLNRLLIDVDLNISPCDAFKQIKASEIVQTESLSNLRNHTLTECWNNSPYLTAIRQFLASGFEMPCVDCDDLQKCLSGCLAQKVIYFGGLKKIIDPACINQ